MYCENCGTKGSEEGIFCTNCGNQFISSSLSPSEKQNEIQDLNGNDEKWWLRLLRVIYIFLCLQIFWIVPLVWSINSTTYVGGYYGSYKDTPETAFWYSILAILIYMSLTRLLKIAVLYVSTGKKPQWAMEFRKFY